MQRFLERLARLSKTTVVPSHVTKRFLGILRELGRRAGLVAFVIVAAVSAWVVILVLGVGGTVFGGIFGLVVLLFAFGLAAFALARWYQRRRFRKLGFPDDRY